MLAQTMNRMKRNYSNTSGKMISGRSSVNQKQQSLINKLQSSPSLNGLKAYQSSNNLTHFNLNLNTIEHTPKQQREQKRGNQVLELGVKSSYDTNQGKFGAKQTPIHKITQNNLINQELKTLVKPSLENTRQMSTSVPKQLNFPRSEIKISPFNLGPKTDRVSVNVDKNMNDRLAAPNNQQIIEIETLKLKVSNIFSQKLDLELKLRRQQEKNKVQSDRIFELVKQIQGFKEDKQLNNQSEYIVQLLGEYQNTKKIIQNLIRDNQMLSKKNDELKQHNIKLRNNQQISQLKQSIKTITKQKKQSLQIVSNYNTQLNKIKQQNNNYLQQITNFNQKQSNIQSQQLTKQLQQTKSILVLKQKQNQHLKEQLVQMNSKMKEVLSEISRFSQVFEVQKASLRKQYQDYKLNSTKQILQLRSMIPHSQSQMNQSAPKPHIFIQDRQDSINTLFGQKSDASNKRH